MEKSTLPKPAAADLPAQGRKIAIFVDDLTATGVVRNAIAIANRLHSEGWQASIVASRAEGPLKDSISSGVAVHQLMDEGSPDRSRTGRLIRSFSGYRRFLRSFRPEILLSAGNHGHLPTALASRGMPGCRVVFRISNDIEHRAGDAVQKRLSGFARRLQLRLVSDRADLMVLVSPHLQGNPIIGKAHSVGKVAVIPNGVDIAAVRRRALETCDHPWLSDASDMPVILGVGRLVRQKNFRALIRAVGLAREVRPLRLLIIGSGPLQDELEGEIQRLGLSDCVAIIPPVTNPMPYLARAAVLALPSWWEGSSNVLLEALACKTPVVASETAGNARLVLADGLYGVLIDPSDVEGIAEAILRQSSEFAIRPGPRALAFSSDRALDAYSTAFTDLVTP
jgi:glycosyltransferase involved in cell wall biosynthesis